MNNPWVLIFAACLLALIVLVSAFKTEKCKKCGMEMRAWDSKKSYCPNLYCNE